MRIPIIVHSLKITSCFKSVELERPYIINILRMINILKVGNNNNNNVFFHYRRLRISDY